MFAGTTLLRLLVAMATPRGSLPRRHSTLFWPAIAGGWLFLLLPPANAQTFRGTISDPTIQDVYHLTFSRDQSILAAQVETKDPRAHFQVRLYDTGTRKEIGRIQLPNGKPGDLFEFSPDGKTLYTCTYLPPWFKGIQVHFWDVKTCKERHSIKFASRRGTWGHATPDGKTLVLLGAGQASLHDTVSGKELCSFEIPKDRFKYPSTFFMPITLSPDGQKLALATMDSEVLVYDLAAGKCLLTLKVDKRPVGYFVDGVAFSRDGKQVVCLGLGRNLVIFDAATGKELSRRVLRGAPSSDQRIPALSADGKSLVVRKQRGAGFGLLDLATGKLQMVGVALAEPYMSLRLAVSRDGNLVAVANKDIRLWSLKAKDEEP
jgi:WD40 repeat protein